ncbi:unnamed protein product [Chrysoparadoxa australica]
MVYFLAMLLILCGLYTMQQASGFCTPPSASLLSQAAQFPAVRYQAGKARSQLLRMGSREEDDFEATVDWDAELKRLRAGEVKQEKPKGIIPDDVSEADINIYRVKKKIREQLPEPIKVPAWKTVSQDWKFWVGIMVVLSVATAVLFNSGGGNELVVYSKSPYPQLSELFC